MNFKKLYDSNCEAIETLLSAMWCGAPRSEAQKKNTDEVKKVIREVFAPSTAYPVVQCMNLYKSVHSVSAETAKALVGNLWTASYPPYEHQYRCWDALLNKKTPTGKPMSIVVTTGTGSGKTECFMMPLVHDLVQAGQTNQIQALFLYPLNALMEDQKERLEKMLEGTNLTYAVYNGDLPEKAPKDTDHTDYAEEQRKRIAQIRGEYKDADGTVKYKFEKILYTRDQVRETPPNILLTNPTMLEYILLRQADASLINPLQKSLRWVVIDETHSYTGAGAAELAMLLRRVLLAFNVNAEDIRFATSSATFGNASTPEEAAAETAKLKAFIGGITGLVPDQIEAVGGVRIGEEAITDNEDKELWKKICKSDFMSIADLFPEGTISEKLGRLEEMCQREEALAGKPDSQKMKVKVHYFYRVPNNGLYVKLTEQKDGGLKIYPHSAFNNADNVPPMLEVSRCKNCGGFVAVAMYDPKTGAYEQLASDESDMFDIEETGAHENNSLHPVMLGIAADGPVMGDGNILLKAEGGKLEPAGVVDQGGGAWYIVGNTNYRCPHCGAKVSKRKNGAPDDADDPSSDKYSRLMRFRLSAEVISRYLAPSILDQLEKNKGAGLVLHDGQQYISFVDSRQAAAISTLNQNLEQEKMWVYSTVFHELCRRKDQSVATKAKIAELKKLRDETDDEEEEEKLSDRIKALRKQLSGAMGWMEVFDLLSKDKYCDVFCKLFAKRSTNSEETDVDGEITESTKAKYVHSVMAEYLARHPKSAPAPETLGLFHATYPQLEKVELPDGVKTFNEKVVAENDKIGEQDWRNLLQIFLDYTVRSNQSLFFKVSDEVKLDVFSLNRFATDKPRRRPVKRPHLEQGNLGMLSRVVSYLGALLAGDGDMELVRNAVKDNLDVVNGVLDDMWKTLTDKTGLLEWSCALNRETPPSFEKDKFDGEHDEPYRMNMVKMSFKLFDNACLCDVNGGEKAECLRPVETVFKGLSLYPTRSRVGMVGESSEEWKVYPYYSGSGQAVDEKLLEEWVSANRKILIESGLWGDDGLYKNKLDDIYLMPRLFIQAEHTAQVDKAVSRTLQTEFKEHRINILACSTTMEMGVDLGNLEVVMLSSVPPMPANYKQRAGRSGRNNKVRSVCMTLCGSDAIGMRTLANPIERIISRPVEVPKVDLMSEQVVKRHVNSYLVRAFGVFGDAGAGGSLTQKVVDFYTPYRIARSAGKKGFLRVEDSTGKPLNPDSGMGDENGTRYKQFSDKCADAEEVAKIKDGLLSLLRDTCYAGEKNAERVIQEAKEANERCYGELSLKIEDIRYAYNHQASGNDKFKAKLEIQYFEVLNERLINYWATNRFTPNANMPVNVLAFNLNSSQNVFKTRFSSNPSYSLREAISQYVPGNCVVVDGIVYKVRGIEFRNMYQNAKFKTISRNSVCVKINEPVPAAIPWTINGKTGLTLVTPTGFMPDFNEDYTRILDDNIYTHVSAQLIGATDWTGDEDGAMMSVRTSREDSGDAKILYYNEGIGHGFCFCSKCGRMVLETDAAPEEDVGSDMPTEMNNRRPKKDGDPCYHFAMTGKNYGKKCIGSNPQEGILRNVIVGDEIQTDYSELRLRAVPGGKWIGTRKGYEKLLYTLAIAFAQSLVEVLGKERGAVDFAITPTGRICIFDTNPGGAGYSNQLKDEKIRKSVVDAARKMLAEAKEKNASDILLDKFTVRHIKDIDVDVAIAWLDSVPEATHPEAGAKTPDPVPPEAKEPEGWDGLMAQFPEGDEFRSFAEAAKKAGGDVPEAWFDLPDGDGGTVATAVLAWPGKKKALVRAEEMADVASLKTQGWQIASTGDHDSFAEFVVD